MIALAASCQLPGAASAASSSITPANLRRVERLADHAGRGEEDLARLAAGRLGGELGGELGRLAAALAGEGIGVARIDHQRARLAALEPGAAPFDRRRRTFRAREHAGDRRALVEQREQHVGAPGSGCRPRRSRAARRRSAACRERARARAERRWWSWRCFVIMAGRSGHPRLESVILSKRECPAQERHDSADGDAVSSSSAPSAWSRRSILAPWRSLATRLGLRLAHQEGLDLVLDLLEFRRPAWCACPRP